MQPNIQTDEMVVLLFPTMKLGGGYELTLICSLFIHSSACPSVTQNFKKLRGLALGGWLSICLYVMHL